jgi:hypothetical protein
MEKMAFVGLKQFGFGQSSFLGVVLPLIAIDRH